MGNCEVVPVPSLIIILWTDPTIFVGNTYGVLRIGKPLFGRLAIPRRRLSNVLLYALTMFVHDSNVILCGSESLIGGFAPPQHRLSIIYCDALALVPS